jgi:hypothetical protein
MDVTDSTPPKQWIAIVVPVVVVVTTAIAVGLRFYTRYALVRKIGVDDWAVAVAYAFTVACGISIAISELVPRALRGCILTEHETRRTDSVLMFGCCKEMIYGSIRKSVLRPPTQRVCPLIPPSQELLPFRRPLSYVPGSRQGLLPAAILANIPPPEGAKSLRHFAGCHWDMGAIAAAPHHIPVPTNLRLLG